MPKRPSRENAKERKCSEDLSDGDKSPKKKSRYYLRKREKDTIWIEDDTLSSLRDSQTPDDESEESEEESEEEKPKYVKKVVEKEEKPSMKLTKAEEAYYKIQSLDTKKELNLLMKRVSSIALDDGVVPNKFRILKLPISDYTKSNVIKKVIALEDMSETGESYKLGSWVDAFLRVPFGRTIPLPVSILDGQLSCTDFMIDARKIMDDSIYGMLPAKTQIMQIIAQLIVNPESVGNVIVLSGPPGIGKTSFAKNAIAKVLKRPFEFFSLGGASDIANFVGHSYTYEGSTWGRIVDSLMHSKVMNPVFYFDELDKVSGTPHGEEIISMLIHLTDRSQNSQFHDRYFSGIDFDLSQCMFVFSLNDIESIHPILRDRMTLIQCGGYNEVDKKVILKNYIWESLLKRLKFDPTDICLKDDAIKYLITEFSGKEKGVRTLIRALESMMTRLNMLRVAKHESMKEYKFFMDVIFPLDITEAVVKKLLCDTDPKEPETWQSMYN